MDRSEWLKQRKTGLGGTDVAAVMGMSNWRKPLDVYNDKTSEEIDFSDSERMYWGRTLEATVAEEYTRRTGNPLTQGQFTRHPEYEWAVGTPDYLAQRWGVEVKTAANEIGWGPEGTAMIPKPYQVQCAWYCFLTGMKRWDVAVLFTGQRFCVYHYFPSPTFIDTLKETAHKFWTENVTKGVPPPAEPRDHALALADLPSSEEIMESDPEIDEAIIRLLKTKQELAEVTERKENLEGIIKIAMQEKAILLSEHAKVSYKTSRGRTVVDWKSIAERLFPLHVEEYIATLIVENTVAKLGTRRFLLKEKKNGKV